MTIGRCNRNVVDIVRTRIARRCEALGILQRQRTGGRVDVEEGRIGPTRDRVGDRGRARIGRRDRTDRGRAFGKAVARSRGDRRGNVTHRHMHRLRAAQLAVGDRNRDIIDVVMVAVGRIVIDRRILEGENAGRRIDVEQGRIGTARDRVGDDRGTAWVGRGHGARTGRTFQSRLIGRRGDRRGDVRHGNREVLDMGRTIRSRARDLDRAAGRSEIGEVHTIGDNDIVAGNAEQRGIRAAGDRVGDRTGNRRAQGSGNRTGRTAFRDRIAGDTQRHAGLQQGRRQRAVGEAEILDILHRISAVNAIDRIGLGARIVVDRVTAAVCRIDGCIDACTTINGVIARTAGDDVIATACEIRRYARARYVDVVDRKAFVVDCLVHVRAETKRQRSTGRRHGHGDAELVVEATPTGRIGALCEIDRVGNARISRDREVCQRQRTGPAGIPDNRQDWLAVDIDLHTFPGVRRIQHIEIEAHRRRRSTGIGELVGLRKLLGPYAIVARTSNKA